MLFSVPESMNYTSLTSDFSLLLHFQPKLESKKNSCLIFSNFLHFIKVVVHPSLISFLHFNKVVATHLLSLKTNTRDTPVILILFIYIYQLS